MRLKLLLLILPAMVLLMRSGPADALTPGWQQCQITMPSDLTLSDGNFHSVGSCALTSPIDLGTNWYLDGIGVFDATCGTSNPGFCPTLSVALQIQSSGTCPGITSSPESYAGMALTGDPGPLDESQFLDGVTSGVDEWTPGNSCNVAILVQTSQPSFGQQIKAAGTHFVIELTQYSTN